MKRVPDGPWFRPLLGAVLLVALCVPPATPGSSDEEDSGESLRTASAFLKERVLPFLAGYEQETDV